MAVISSYQHRPPGAHISDRHCVSDGTVCLVSCVWWACLTGGSWSARGAEARGKMDLRRLVQAMRRYRIIVAAVAVLGLAVGVGYTFAKPPTQTSRALVWLPSTKNVQTNVLIAESTPVLEGAALTLKPHMQLASIRKQVQIGNLTGNILSISASASTADGAEDMADAVANSYLTYISQPNSPGGRMFGKMAQSGTTATG